MIQDKNGSTLYMQLKDRILTDLSGAVYFTPLPGERELCKTYGVSRPTVRKALEILEEEKKIVRMQGKGSFFLGNKAHVDAPSAQGMSFYDEVQSSGGYTRSKVLLQNAVIPSKVVAARLALGEREMVFHLERLRYINDELYSLANAYIPLHLCPELIRVDFSSNSLYEQLKHYGIFPYRMEKVLEIMPANEYEAMHLEIAKGDPVSVMQTIAYDAEDTIIEYAVSKSLAYKTRYEMRSYSFKEDNNGRNCCRGPE